MNGVFFNEVITIPKRQDIKKVIIGSGPIIIGQACGLITPVPRLVRLANWVTEFLVNSNPATVTDPKWPISPISNR